MIEILVYVIGIYGLFMFIAWLYNRLKYGCDQDDNDEDYPTYL